MSGSVRQRAMLSVIAIAHVEWVLTCDDQGKNEGSVKTSGERGAFIAAQEVKN